MQTSKCLTAICAVALLAGATQLRAETEAQAKAREALYQKMRELDAQQPSAVAPQAPVKRRAPEVTPPAAPARPEPPPPVAAPPPVKAAPPVAAPTPAPAFATVPEPSDTPEVARARAALYQKMIELESQPPPPPEPPVEPAQVVTTVTPPPRKPAKDPRAVQLRTPESTFKSIEAPPLPITPSQEARLAELLQKYKADEIGPGEYQKQRAEILAKP